MTLQGRIAALEKRLSDGSWRPEHNLADLLAELDPNPVTEPQLQAMRRQLAGVTLRDLLLANYQGAD